MKKALLLILIYAICSFKISYGQEKLEIEGAITLKDSEDSTPEPGTIRWTGTDFEGWNGQRWVSLTGYTTVGNVTDIDGNTYQTTRIGNQEWMIENLRVSKYNDNTVIDQITNNTTWSVLSTGAWCWYDNNSGNEDPYGKLYNWYTVATNKLCPTGWHVPSDTEWTTLTDYLGGIGRAGGKMKTTGTIQAGTGYWQDPNTGATNESGFTGLPGGIRSIDGSFFNLGHLGNWWSSTESSINAAYRYLYYLDDNVVRVTNDKRLGFSVRCVRD